MPSQVRHFLDWSVPALDQAVAFLQRGWREGPLDLRRTLVVVPTRHAGRRLRERLAAAAAARGTAVLAGRVITPAQLFAPAAGPVPVADPLAARLVWMKVLRATPPAAVSELFPAWPAAPDSARCAATAELLMDLRARLAEEGHTLASFAARLGAANPEPERWAQLAALEQACVTALAREGWRDAVTAQLAAAEAPVLAEEADRIVVFFVTDPPPLALRALEHLAGRLPVELCIHAPESERPAFDAWGRPEPAAWANRFIDIPDDRLLLAADAAGEADALRTALAAHEGAAVGLANPALVPTLRRTLEAAGRAVFDPAGEPMAGSPLFGWLAALAGVLADPTRAAVRALIGHPHVLAWLARGIPGFQEDLALADFDALCAEHLPADLSAITARASDPPWRETRVPALVARITELREALAGRPLHETLPAVLTRVYEGCRWRPHVPDEAALQAAARELADLLDQFRRAPGSADLPPEEALPILLGELRQRRLSLPRPKQAVDLLGWLEWPWEDAPVFLLGGMNDEYVPEAIIGDAFLPDPARAGAGLRDNRHRYARDAALLTAVLHSRPAGSAALFLSRRTAEGDPLKPSRLLLAVPDDRLADRALALFGGEGPEAAAPPRVIGWKLTLPAPAPVTRLYATQFRSYLECPFRFYLQSVLGMRPYETPGLEMGADVFGTLAHEALRQFAHSRLCDSDDASAITAFLVNQAEELVRARYGGISTAPLIIQLESLRQRLTAAARVQAAHRREGWRIERVETREEIRLAGLTVVGRIDRVDVHEATGERLVLDYKTGNAVADPAKEHLGVLRDGDEPFRRAADTGRAWTDLQIPFYVHLVRQRAGGSAPVRGAYFLLPAHMEHAAIAPWPDLDDALVASAAACAAEIARRVAAGVFWPPRLERVKTDDDPWNRLFFDLVGPGVEAAALTSVPAVATPPKPAAAARKGKR